MPQNLCRSLNPRLELELGREQRFFAFTGQLERPTRSVWSASRLISALELIAAQGLEFRTEAEQSAGKKLEASWGTDWRKERISPPK